MLNAVIMIMSLIIRKHRKNKNVEVLVYLWETEAILTVLTFTFCRI